MVASSASTRARPAVVVSLDGQPDRLGVLRSLVPGGSPLTVTSPAQLAPLEGAAVVVADGAAPFADPEVAAAVRRAVEEGATLLALGATPASQLVDPPAGEPLPAAEWFVKPTAAAARWTARLPGEWALTGTFTPLAPRPGVDTLAVVNVAFVDRPVLTRRRWGAGSVVTCALAGSDSLRSPTLARLLARLGVGEPPAADTLGMAVVGYGPLGGMGLYHGMAAGATAGIELMAVCDASPERLKAAVSEFPGISAYATPAELASDAGVDVVVVATPPSSHAELAQVFLRAGKHVVAEKPLCFTPAQADRLIAAADDAGVVLTVHQNRRWDRDFAAVRRTVESGELGTLFNMETFVGGFEHPCRAWHSELSVSGGAIYDWGAHYLDWTLLLLGDDPLRVTATGHKRVWRDVTNEDQVRVRLHWADGREAEFVHSDVAAVRRPKLYLQGTRGTLVGWYRPVTFERIEPALGYRAEIAHHAEAPAELTLASYEGDGLGVVKRAVALAPTRDFAFHANLADHLLLGEPLAVDPRSARQVVAVLDAAQRSLSAGGTPTTPVGR